MIINLEKNTIFVTNETHKPCVRASVNIERIYDPSEVNGDIAIALVYTIYVYNMDGSKECGELYKEYYKELLCTIGVLYPGNVYYINTFEDGEVINCLSESMLENNSGVKIPHKTNLKILRV